MPRPYRSLALVALITTACNQGPPSSAGWQGTVDTLPGGTVRVVNQAGGAWRGNPWRLAEDLRLGHMDGKGPDVFGEIVAVDADAMGRIWVADAQAGEIRVFGPDGAHVRTLGRRGAGPGEFAGLAGMTWGPDGNLWVMDNGNARVSVFDTAGTYRTAHARPSGLMVTPWRGGFDREGWFYDQGVVPGKRTMIPVLNRFGPSMEAAGSLPLPQPAPDEFVHEGATTTLRASVPFTPYLVWRLDRTGGIWAGISDRYRLARIRFGGDTSQVIERHVERVPVTAEERKEALQELSWFTDAGGRVDPSRIPQVKPAFRSVTVDDGGFIWVRPEQRRGEPAVLDVFEPTGRFLGSVTLPSPPGPFPLITVRGNYVYAAIRGNDDEPVVVRWHIVGRP